MDCSQSNPDEIEGEAPKYHSEGWPPPLLFNQEYREKKPSGEIQQELKGLGDSIASLSQKLETLQVSSDGKSIPLPSVVAGLDPTVVHEIPRAWQSLTVSHESPLQATIRKATDRGEDVEGFQMFPVIKQRDAQGNLVRMHLPIPFKQLKELKASCTQCSLYSIAVGEYSPSSLASQGLETSRACRTMSGHS